MSQAEANLNDVGFYILADQDVFVRFVAEFLDPSGMKIDVDDSGRGGFVYRPGGDCTESERESAFMWILRAGTKSNTISAALCTRAGYLKDCAICGNQSLASIGA